MKKLLIAFMALSLSGCAHFLCKEPDQIVKYKYIVTTVPDDLLTIPAPIYKIDPTKATDKETGLWMIDSERRAIEIEKKLKQIKELQDKQLQDMKKLPADDVITK
jgi:hypothetical protein